MFVVLLKYCLLINSINYVQSIAINTNDLMEYANNNPPIKSYDFVNNDLKTHKKCRRASKDDQQNDDITNQLKNVQQLKEEVANLSNLVQILRDQQYLLTLLNDVDEFGNKQSRDGVDIMVLKDEVDQLRNQMEESRKEATNTDQIEKTLKEQIEEERKEIDSLKKTIVKILDARNDLKTKNSNEITKQKTDVAKSKQLLTKLEKELFDLKQKINEENSENNDEAIVRAPLDLKLPKDIKPIIKNPVVKPPELKFVLPDPLHLKNPISNQRNAEEDQSRNLRIFDDDINQMESKLNKLENQRKFQQRDSSTNLRKLLKSIDDDSDEDIDEFVDEFKKQLSKKKRKQQKEERVKALIKSLDKSNDLDSLESKSDDDTDTLKLLLKVLDKSKPQSKSDDIDNELKLLQQAIDEMQPKDEIDLIDDRDDDLNLNKLLALRGGKSQKVDKIALLRKQLLQLKKQRPLDSISHNPYTNSGPYANRNFYPYPFPMNSNMYSTNPMNSNGYPLSFVNSYPTNSNFYPVNSNSYAINSNAYPSGTNAYNSHPIGTNPYPIASSNSFSVNNNPYTSNSNSYASNSNAYPINSNVYSIPNSLYDNLMSNYYHQSNEQKSYNKPQLNNYPFGNLNKLQYSNAQPQPSLNSYSSNFFHVAGSPLPNYQEAHQEIYKPAINPIQTNQQESQDYQAQTVNVGQDYTQQKVDDLRNQIYNLQGVINNLNKPEYVQKPEDQQMIYNLDTRINELKNVIGHLNEKSYVVPQPQNNHNEYPPINYHSNIEPSYAQPKSHSDESNHELITIHDDEHHEEARHRSARSTDSDLKQIVSILEKHLLNEDDQNNKVTARSNLDLNEKLEELKEQLGNKPFFDEWYFNRLFFFLQKRNCTPSVLELIQK